MAIDLKKKVGPFPLWVWVLGGVAVVGYLYFRSTQDKAPDKGDGQAGKPQRGRPGKAGHAGARGKPGERGKRGRRGRHGKRGGGGGGSGGGGKREVQGTMALAAMPQQLSPDGMETTAQGFDRADYAQEAPVNHREMPLGTPASQGPWAAYPTAANVYALGAMDGTEVQGDGGSAFTGSDPADSSGDDIAPRTAPDGRSQEVPKMGMWSETPEGWAHEAHPAGSSPAMAGGTTPNGYAFKDTPPTHEEYTPLRPSEDHPAEGQEVMGQLNEAPAHLEPVESDR